MKAIMAGKPQGTPHSEASRPMMDEILKDDPKHKRSRQSIDEFLEEVVKRQDEKNAKTEGTGRSGSGKPSTIGGNAGGG